jgi:hypothetical protein
MKKLPLSNPSFLIYSWTLNKGAEPQSAETKGERACVSSFRAFLRSFSDSFRWTITSTTKQKGSLSLRSVNSVQHCVQKTYILRYTLVIDKIPWCLPPRAQYFNARILNKRRKSEKTVTKQWYMRLFTTETCFQVYTWHDQHLQVSKYVFKYLIVHVVRLKVQYIHSISRITIGEQSIIQYILYIYCSASYRK